MVFPTRRAGIVTIHHSYNYGALLQAWGLRQTIRDLGWSVDLIDFRPPGNNDWYEDYARSLRRHYPRLNRWSAAFRAKATALDRFIADELAPVAFPHSPSGLPGVDDGYDVLVAGSDQLWTLEHGLHRSYFLDGAPDGVGRVAYAPSFGGTDDLGAHADTIAGLLRRFDAVSARDENTAGLVRAAGVADPTRVIDPALLADLSRLERPWDGGPAVVLYCESRLTPVQAAHARAVANERGLPLVSIGFPHRVADVNLVELDLGQWLGAFRSAAYVVTGLFHGTVLAIRYGVDFTAFVSPSRAHKVIDVLRRFDLLDRLELDRPRHGPDPRVPDRLADLKAESIAWLATAMDAAAPLRPAAPVVIDLTESERSPLPPRS